MPTELKKNNIFIHNSNNYYSNKILIGDHEIEFSSGKIAKNTAGSVIVKCEESIVLATVCSSLEPKTNINFLPLTCDYIEKTYASGKIPAGFFKRESKPKDHEILRSRIIDRSIRPLFPNNYNYETQIITTVISHNGQQDTDVLALCGAAMALHISNIPIIKPIAGIKIGKINDKLIANPSISQQNNSDINLLITSSKDSIIMIEGHSQEISKDDIIEAINFAQEYNNKIINTIIDMGNMIGKIKTPWNEQSNDDMINDIKTICNQHKLSDILNMTNKRIKNNYINKIKNEIINKFSNHNENIAIQCFDNIKKNIIRNNLITTKTRQDGRKYNEIRQIYAETNCLPRTHGSAIFTRGETQALVTLTLGTREDEQKIETLANNFSKKFMLHYNFMPFCVNETRILKNISRREIGHGSLAEKAIANIIPNEEEFPYTIRLVSDILESNGSSSMATVCGASLALLDGGVNIKNIISGIAMGLIKNDQQDIILSDISGDEDHIGDIDFKICGTQKGITAIQMDVKNAHISTKNLQEIFTQATQGYLYILNKIKNVISTPNKLSLHAPKIVSFNINPTKIRDVIGVGGKIIKNIISKTNTKIDINDNGTVQVSGVSLAKIDHAIEIIKNLSKTVEINMVYKGLVKKIFDFGAFIEIFPGTEGLCHISELSHKRVNTVNDILKEGDQINIAVTSINKNGKIRLSYKKAKDKNPGDFL